MGDDQDELQEVLTELEVLSACEINLQRMKELFSNGLRILQKRIETVSGYVGAPRTLPEEAVPVTNLRRKKSAGAEEPTAQ